MSKAEIKGPEIKLLGIRHHGPGSARSVVSSLNSFTPDCLLIEGPPEGDYLIKYVQAEGLAPPVALLVYAQEHPRQACYYPFAEFSPEWQALTYAVKKGIACRFMDLPQANWLALSERKLEKLREKAKLAAEQPAMPDTEKKHQEPSGKNSEDLPAGEESKKALPEDLQQSLQNLGPKDLQQSSQDPAQDSGPEDLQQSRQQPLPDSGPDTLDDSVPTRRESLVGQEAPRALSLKQQIRLDPIGALARSAGFSDGERWWEQLVEQRRSEGEIFAGINEAMAALRSELSEPDKILVIQREDDTLEDEKLYEDLDDRIEPLREAHMRLTLRKAIKEGFRKIAIVCGAWHGPAFNNISPSGAKSDAQLLKGLPRVKVEATWIPWTHGRLQFSSGYGAGVESPGWYEHIFKEKFANLGGPTSALSWLVKVAHLLRQEDLDASSAQVIDAFRLAEAMASMRELTYAGLEELNEATVSVLCGGNLTPLALIYKKLIVGERLGVVPVEVPGTPLQRDLIKQQTTLRLKPEASAKVIELDLRKPFDLEKSQLLHRLIILNIDWGEKQDLAGKTSTFHEQWELEWQPHLSIAVVEAGIWGRTIAQAATGKAVEQSKSLASFASLVRLLELTMEAALPDALPSVISRVDSEAAVLGDILELLKALPILAKIARYGSVRGSASGHVREMIDALVVRVCINLPSACSSLDDDAAALMDRLLAEAYAAINLLDQKHHKEAFHSTLDKLAGQQGLHGQIAGRATRLLFDCNYIDGPRAFVYMNHALGQASQASYAGQWLMGFLSGSGLVLIHDQRLFQLVDSWLGQLKDEHFVETLPLLRRTFGGFTSSERISIGELAKNSKGYLPDPSFDQPDLLMLNGQRLEPVLSTLRLIFGLAAVSEVQQ